MNKNMKNFIFAFLTITILLGGCSHESTNPSANISREIANTDLEELVREVITYTQSNISLERKNEIKIVQENLMKYLVEATSGTDAYKVKMYHEAENYFNKVYPLILFNLRNEKAGIQEFKVITKAPIWTLKEELLFLNKDAAKLPAPQVRVDLVKALSLLTSIYKKIDGQNILGAKFDLYPNLKDLDALLASDLSDEARILRVINPIEAKIKIHEARIRNIGQEIIKSGQVDMNNPQMKIIIPFMDYYFKNIQIDVVKTIMSEFVTGGTKLTEEEVMKIVFQNTGPGLGKVLQQIGKDKAVSGSLSKVMEILESSGKEVPIHLVEAVVKNDKGGFEVRAIEGKIGTGTIAQVNKGRIWVDNKEVDVALRFLKPGVAERCKEDIKILRRFTVDNEALFLEGGMEDTKMMATLIDSVEKFLNEEVQLKIAVERQKKAFEVYNRSVKISGSEHFDLLEMRVPEVYMPPSGSSNLHIQEFAAGGVKFSSLDDKATKKIVAQEMVRMWFEEALFKSGFLNADLHQGNFRIALIEENKKIKIILYDFGLSSTLTKADQRAFLLIGAATYLKSPKMLTEGLMVSIDSKDSALRGKLLEAIKKEMKHNSNKKPEDWIMWCVQKNYFVSDNLGAFARGSLLIKQLPQSIGEENMFKDMIMKATLDNLVHSIADRDYDFPLTKIDMIKAGSAQVTNYCQSLVESFF